MASGSYNFGPSHNSGLRSEALANDQIPVEKIIGLMIPKKLLYAKLYKINFLQGGADGTFHLRCQELLKFLNENGIEDPDLYNQISIPKNKEEILQLEKKFNELIHKYISNQGLDLESDCLIDLLKFLIPSGSELKLYDEKGFEINNF